MKALVALLPLVAWSLSVSLALWLRWFLDGAGATVLVPLVSISDSAGSDVVSDIAALAIVLGWGLLCALLVEPAKAVAHSTRRPVAVYSLLVVYQIVLIADAIRAHAADWWSWLLSLLGVVTLKSAADVGDIAAFQFPWMSLSLAIVVSAVAVRLVRTGPTKLLPNHVSVPS